MSDRILVMGAGGNLGGEILRQFRTRDAEVIAGDRRRPPSLDRDVAWVHVDYTDAGSLGVAMSDVDVVFMVLPNHPEMEAWGKSIIDIAVDRGARHIVRSGDSLANSKSQIMIERTFGITDEYLASAGIDYTVTAPCFFMQNFIYFWREDYVAGALRQPAGDGKAAWVDLRDIAAVNVEILLSPEHYRGQFLRITGGESFSYSEAVQRMNRVLGLASSYVPISDEVAIEIMKEKGYSAFDIEVLLGLNHSMRAGNAEPVSNVVSDVLGRPPIVFEQFIRDHRGSWLS